MPARRYIDKLVPGDLVTLGFCNSSNEVYKTEPAEFVGITGTGDERRATFRSVEDWSGCPFEWDAYRYKRTWCYGTSAQRVQLMSIDRPAQLAPTD